MSRICSLFETWKAAGCREAFKLVWSRMKSRTTLLLLERVGDPALMSDTDAGPGITFREGTPADIDEIGRVWPSAFGAGIKPPKLLHRELEKKFELNTPCFVACAADGSIVAGLWCIVWKFDSALPPELKGRAAYEFNAMFSAPHVRTQFFLPIKLMNYAMRRMFEREGKTVGYSRALKTHRNRANVTQRRLGFRNLGLLTNGCCWGRAFCYLEESPQPPQSRLHTLDPET
jgi:hypothetical protein